MHLIERCLETDLGSVERKALSHSDPINDAINSYAYRLAEAIIGLLPRTATPGVDSLSGELQELFQRLLSVEGLPRARSALALEFRLLYFHTLDPAWTEAVLLPLLSADTDEVQRYAWCGFLWNMKFTPSLAEKLVRILPEALRVVSDVEITRPNLGALPVALSYYYPELLPAEALRGLLTGADSAVLSESIRGVIELLPDVDSLDTAWDNWISALLGQGLPAQMSCYSELTSNAFVDLVVALNHLSAEAFEMISRYLVPVSDIGYSIHRMMRSERFVERWPRLSLDVVRILAGPQQASWHRHEVEEFVDAVVAVDHSLRNTEAAARYLSNLIEAG